jgi:protoporphyrinogen oxidase
MSAREHFGIVGGGLLGLTLALRLAQRGYRVTLLEAADHVGGLADAWQLGDVTWDRHYHVTLQSDQHLRSLLRELQLDQDLRWSQTRTGFFVDGQLYSLSSVWGFLRFPPLGIFDKLRLGWTIWYASRLQDWKKLEQVSVADWLVRHSGRRTFERIWLPLLKAKLGNAWQRTSAAFIWATIQRMYAARRTGAKREMFGYLPGGYARTLGVLRQKLVELGVEIRTSSPVERILEEDGRIDVILGAADQLTFDRVVVTTPAPVAARICSGLGAAETNRLLDVEYVGIVCASLLMRQPLAGFYVTNITDPAPFTGVIEMSALVDPAEFGGKTLIYLPRYATADDSVWTKSDEEIRGDFLAALGRFYPSFSPNDVLAFRISRVRQVFALSTLNYSSRLPAIETSVPGLYVVTSAQIVNGTLNVNETVRLAESSLETLCRPLQRVEPKRTAVSRVERAAPINSHDQADRELIARPG